jgi:hypothetical protein
MVRASERNAIDEEAAVDAGTLSQFLGGKLRAKEEQNCALEAPWLRGPASTHNIRHGHGPGARSQEPGAEGPSGIVFETHGGIPDRGAPKKNKKTASKKKGKKQTTDRPTAFFVFFPCCLLNQMAQQCLVLRFLQMPAYMSSSRVALMISKSCSANG